MRSLEKEYVDHAVLPDHLLELDHVGMVELLEGFDLPQVHDLAPGVVLALHGLDGNTLLGLLRHEIGNCKVSRLDSKEIPIVC